jgi:hypothetical protein
MLVVDPERGLRAQPVTPLGRARGSASDLPAQSIQDEPSSSS